MKYNCRECKFTWEGTTDRINEVLDHEKTHKPLPEKPKEVVIIECC